MYNGGILDMRASRLWSKVKIPVRREDGKFRVVPFDQLGVLRITDQEGIRIDTRHGRVCLRDGSVTPRLLYAAIIASTRMSVAECHCVFEGSDVAQTAMRLRERVIPHAFSPSIYELPYFGDAEAFLAVSTAVRTVNANHSLVRARKSESASISPLDRFISAFLYFVTDPAIHEWLRGSDSAKEWVRRIGKLFVGVDWKAVNASLRPPYLLYLHGLTITISEQDLIRWADGKR